MRSTLVLIFSAMICFSPCASAQGEPVNPREAEPSGLGLSIGGVIYCGICFDTYLTNELCLELDLGAVAGAGLDYHHWGSDPERKWSPFIGFHGGVIPQLEIDIFGDDDDEDEETILQPDIYIPVGVHYISDSGFSLRLEMGYLHAFENEDAGAFDLPMVGIKIGFRL